MALTYQLIASNTLSSSAASVTFSSIPNTYTDLVLRMSVRSDRATVNDSAKLVINGSTATNYPVTILNGDGSTAQSSRWTNTFGYSYLENCFNGTSSTANTFSSIEIYFPNYAGNTSKPFSVFDVTETNATAVRMQVQANQWTLTSAITSLEISSANAVNLLSGSSFFLYGIKSS